MNDFRNFVGLFMVICAAKLTHDATLALIDNGKLIFSIEFEKMDNNNRHTEYNGSIEEIELILNGFGYSLKRIDSLVLDGWVNGYIHELAAGDGIQTLALHGYDPIVNENDVLDVQRFDQIDVFPAYKSYQHISGHVVGAYCSSPFSRTTESSYIMAWDAAIGAQLYYFDGKKKTFCNLGWVHYIYGAAYAEFARNFYPFSALGLYDMSIPGKVMAYVGKGVVNSHLLTIFHECYTNEVPNWSDNVTNDSCRQFSKRLQRCILDCCGTTYRDEDIMATFHEFLAQITINGLRDRLNEHPNYTTNLCYAGGCALNIKWNRDIRRSDIFSNVWVPPFPNDSGSAIGAACCEMIREQKNFHLQWDIFKGPYLSHAPVKKKLWNKVKCDIDLLSKILFHSNEPIVFLNGRAELGPRALGHRSILATATSPDMKALINAMKNREDYRPVAPVCLEEEAERIFEPGTYDPFMLYDHKVRSEWVSIIPAICHLDGTARLQTVSREGDKDLYLLLTKYYKLSGIPLLCNTSANFKGKGFFPDVNSAIEWGRCNFVWHQQLLWYNSAKADNEFLTAFELL